MNCTPSWFPGQAAARRLRGLWRDGQAPDVRTFLAETGPLDVTQMLSVLLIDQRERWRRGERVLADWYLDVSPLLRDDPEQFLDLVYNEFLLRERGGEAPSLEEYAARFPPLADELRLQIELHRLVAPEEKATLPTPGEGPGPIQADERWPRIPGYRLVNRVGQGGMGIVYKAWQEGLQRFVALKMLHSGGFDAEQSARFRTEAALAAGLQHPNIVQVYEVGDHDGGPYFSMELVEGGSLADHLRGQAQPARTAAALLATLARAVDHAHRHGIIHRDLKPANVLVQTTEDTEDTEKRPKADPSCLFSVSSVSSVVKITDFGLARRLDDLGCRTQSGAILGTPNYMAPEQAAGRSRAIGPATDVYSLGAILYELLTGRPPFVGATALETLEQVRTQEPVPPSQLNRQLPRDLTIICLKCLEKEPARRYASAAELADELDRFLQHRPIRARRVGLASRLGRWCRRNPIPAALTAAVMLALLLGTAASTWFGLEAREQASEARANEQRALEEKRTADRRLYITDLLLAQRDWDQAQLGHMRYRLDRQRPAHTGVEDLRHFEWHYWNRLAQSRSVVFRGHTSWVRSAAFSPDGKRIASGGDDGVVRVWEAATGKEVLRIFEPLPSGKDRIQAVAFSPDGRYLASAEKGPTRFGQDKSGVVRIWDANDGRLLADCRGHEGRVYSLAFRPDGRQLASVGDSGSVRLWEVPGGRELHVLRDVKVSSLYALAYHPTRPWLATGGSDSILQIWDTEEGKEVQTVRCPEPSIYSLSFSADGTRLATGNGDGGVRIWAPAAGRWDEHFPGHSNWVLGVAFHRDGRLASSSLDHTIRIWDPASKEPVRILRGHDGPVWSVAFSPEGERLVSASEDQTVRVWALAEGLESVPFPPHRRQSTSMVANDVRGLAFSADGRYLATCSEDFTVQVRHPRTGAVLWTLPDHKDGVSGVAFRPDSAQFASAGYDHAVRLWDPSDGRLLNVLSGHTERVYSVAYHPEGGLLASAGADRVVRLWDAAGRPAGTLDGHSDTIFHVVFSPDGRLLATASRDESVKVWDVATRRLLRTFKSHERAYKGVKALWGNDGYGLAFSPDGRFIASAVLDRRVLIWEAETGRVQHTLQGHIGLVNGVAFTPDGKRLASAGEDKTVKLWELTTGQETLTLRGHAHPVLCVAFRPDGHGLVSGDTDGRLRAWDARPLPEE